MCVRSSVLFSPQSVEFRPDQTSDPNSRTSVYFATPREKNNSHKVGVCAVVVCVYVCVSVRACVRVTFSVFVENFTQANFPTFSRAAQSRILKLEQPSRARAVRNGAGPKVGIELSKRWRNSSGPSRRSRSQDPPHTCTSSQPRVSVHKQPTNTRREKIFASYCFTASG